MAEHLNEYFSKLLIRTYISSLTVPEVKFGGLESEF